MTLTALFNEEIPPGRASDNLIRISPQLTTALYVLQPDHRIGITPSKMEGAAKQLMATVSQAGNNPSRARHSQQHCQSASCTSITG